MRLSGFHQRIDNGPQPGDGPFHTAWIAALSLHRLRGPGRSADPPESASRLGHLCKEICASPIDQLTFATGIVTAIALWALGLAHVVSREPLWLWLVVVLVALASTFGGQVQWRRHPSNALAHFRIATQVIIITAIMYLTGWGPVLGIGYVVIVRDLATQMGSRYWRALAVWAAAGCAGGCAAIALRIAPTLLGRPSVYGLAGLVGLGTVFAIALLGLSGENMEAAQESLQESEHKLRQTIATANEAYVELEGRSGIITEWNSRAEEIFGWSRQEVLGRSYGDLVVPESRKSNYHERLTQALNHSEPDGSRRQDELTFKHRDGHEFLAELSSWRTESKAGKRLNIFLEDITLRVAAMEDLQRSNDNFRLLFEQHPHPMWVYDLKTYRFLEVNNAATERYGYARDQFLSMSIRDIQIDTDAAMLMDDLQSDGPGVTQPGVWQHRTSSGEILEVEISSHVLDFHGRQGMLVMAQDVTERCRLEQQLHAHALHDPLTGLPNRSLLLDRLERLIAQAKRVNTRAHVMCLNVDNFKLVNDAYGHDVGDALLRALGERLVGALRDVDTVGRIGGDEFVILTAPPEPEANPELVAEKMLDLVRSQPFRIGGNELTVTASIGINAGMGGESAEVFRNADVALCAAKADGGNRCAVFAQEMRTAVHERVELAKDLREAIRTGQIESFFQPVVGLSDLQVVGVEALARWRHPVRGLLDPAQFIPLAEELGMIGELGNHVLRQACAHGALWQRRYHGLSVAVNVSVFQLRSNEFLSTVAEALEQTSFLPENLVLEITESVLINDPETIASRLKALKEIGVRLAIDDFGTGYSSFTYLRQLPFDILKIDQSFIASITESLESETMLRTMIELGRQLNLEIVAEGVEEEDQLDLLRHTRCHRAQGYLFSRPVDAASTTQMLAHWVRHGRPAA
jgi:diguanylate cyclase (GGDEF)-like protein/PAS domain S-box-containing protein